MVIHYTKNTKKEAKLVLKMLTSFRITKVDKSCELKSNVYNVAGKKT